MKVFTQIQLEYIVRGKNTRVDALAELAAIMSAFEGKNYEANVYERRILPPLETIRAFVEFQQRETLTARIMVIEGIERDSRDPFISFFKYGIVLEELIERVVL